MTERDDVVPPTIPVIKKSLPSKGLIDDTSLPRSEVVTHASSIENWFVREFYGSVVSRDTQIFNHVRAAVDRLKQIL